MTELRRRMIEDMELHGLAKSTQRVYVDAIRALAGHFKRPPDQLSEDEVRAFIGHLTKTRRLAEATVRVYHFAIKFLYGKTLEASEFIRRFLQHVLPTGVHKIRSYGLWAPSKRRLLRQIQLLLADDGASPPPNQAALPPGAGNQSTEDPQPARPAGQICPHCGKGVLLHLQRLPWNGRAPP